MQNQGDNKWSSMTWPSWNFPHWQMLGRSATLGVSSGAMGRCCFLSARLSRYQHDPNAPVPPTREATRRLPCCKCARIDTRWKSFWQQPVFVSNCAWTLARFWLPLGPSYCMDFPITADTAASADNVCTIIVFWYSNNYNSWNASNCKLRLLIFSEIPVVIISRNAGKCNCLKCQQL